MQEWVIGRCIGSKHTVQSFELVDRSGRTHGDVPNVLLNVSLRMFSNCKICFS